jgi:hypothetical protein
MIARPLSPRRVLPTSTTGLTCCLFEVTMFPRPPSKPPHLARLSFPNSTYIRRNSARFSTASALGYNHQHLDPSPSHVLSSHPDQPGGQGGLTEGREAAGQAGETAGRLIAVGFDASLNVSEAYLAGEVAREEQLDAI